MARRHGDDETSYLAAATPLEMMRDRLDVKVVLVLYARIDDPKGSLNETCEVVSLCSIQDLAQMLWIVALLPQARFGVVKGQNRHHHSCAPRPHIIGGQKRTCGVPLRLST